MFRTVASPLAACLVIAACTHNVPVELTPKYDEATWNDSALATVRPALVFARGTFADKRADTTTLATFKQQVHTYHLRGERPVSDALFDGLRSLVVHAGHRWAGDGEAADVRLDVQLLNVQAARNAGIIHVGATSNVQIKVDVVDVRADRVLHSDVYNGTDERQQALIGMIGMVKASLDASIINCVNSVGGDASMVAALRRAREGGQ